MLTSKPKKNATTAAMAAMLESRLGRYQQDPPQSESVSGSFLRRDLATGMTVVTLTTGRQVLGRTFADPTKFVPGDPVLVTLTPGGGVPYIQGLVERNEWILR